MVPLISIVGADKNCCRAVLRQLIQSLQGKGHRVGLLCRTPNLPEEPKSLGLEAVGPDLLCLTSDDGFFLKGRTKGEGSPAWYRDNLMPETGLVFAEGWAEGASFPKIEVARRADGPGLLFGADNSLFSVVADFKPEIGIARAVPLFDFEETEALSELLQITFLQREEPGPKVELYVDGRSIFLAEFVQKLFSTVIGSLTELLKDVGRFREVVLKIRR